MGRKTGTGRGKREEGGSSNDKVLSVECYVLRIEN